MIKVTAMGRSPDPRLLSVSPQPQQASPPNLSRESPPVCILRTEALKCVPGQCALRAVFEN